MIGNFCGVVRHFPLEADATDDWALEVQLPTCSVHLSKLWGHDSFKSEPIRLGVTRSKVTQIS